MLDLNFIRKNPEEVKRAVREKHERVDVDHLLRLDADRRELLHQIEVLRKQLNEGSKRVSELKRQKQDAATLVEEMRVLSDKIKGHEKRLDPLTPEIDDLLLRIPNIPAPDIPKGEDASGNQVVRTWGKRREFSFKPRPHWELGASLGILDLERGAKICGSGFPLYKGIGARLERALFNFMLDLHTRKHGYQEVFPPFLVNRASMTGTGQLPKMEEDMYRTSDDLFLVPTAEVPVTNLHRDEILSHKELPIYYTAYTACFRREAGAYGKDTRGIIRVHQFDKVELVKFVRPETSYEELEKLVKDAEEVLQLLGLEYRVLKLCTGDMSFASSKTYDLEAWAPGVEKWLEVSSCSNFEDFQARRINIRFREEPASGGKVRYVHTLNGSGIALPRTLIAILENYQQKDGSVIIPEVLRPYMGGVEVISQ
ncbi:MAG: serine--tRNA ligase [Candidatus Brocadiaceae bacterium]|nr:serine--tRNA ligase [Candidatus Brocadiaceae bacterium]